MKHIQDWVAGFIIWTIIAAPFVLVALIIKGCEN